MDRDKRLDTPITPKAIRRQRLSEMLVEALRERILIGDIQDGDPLVQETIAQQYEVSRVPVREALRQLEAQGLVSLRTHKGAVATSIKRETAIELLHLRVLLECDVLVHALPHFRESHRFAAEKTLDELENKQHDKSVSESRELNWQFYKCLYLPSSRLETLSIVHIIHMRTYHLTRVPFVECDRVHATYEKHRELLRLCGARSLAAIDYLRRDIHSILKSLR
ncbi:GntR family transcriptional regulator [Mesorhizobium sp. SARCC-RB16n]|uniref:GntR family transcriptional regulator n=1 Tax=Mesorhizobium sp. SARCC-RB16n TaxID=2116687 RepID=UPI00122F99B6|nr:GntR family transcriptional regulator [Mesorhizobium sp. SARCC-RB16n]